MKVLVTGGSGFIGTRLVEALLAAGHQARIYDIVRSKVFPDLTTIGNVLDTGLLRQEIKDHDNVVHLAAVHRDNVRPLSRFDEVNVGGAQSLILACREAGCMRVIFTSTAAVYPMKAGERDETCSPAPFSRYGQSKLEAEKVLRDWAENTKDAQLTILRPSVVFGEGNRGNMYRFLKQVCSRKYIPIGDGNNRKSICYVGNIVSFITTRLDVSGDDRMHVINYADKPDLSINEMVSIAQETMGINSWAGRVRIPYGVAMSAASCCDLVARVAGRPLLISRKRIVKLCAPSIIGTPRLAELGFEAPFSLKEALERTIRHEFLNGRRQ